MAVPAKQPKFSDTELIGIAREIAFDIHDAATIFQMYDITPADWQKIQKNHTFRKYVETYTAEWNACTNTEQRVRMKTAAIIEGWLPEMNRKVWATGETLPAKTELMKFAARLAGQGFSQQQTEGAAERVIININTGKGKPIRIEEHVTPKVIDLDPGT